MENRHAYMIIAHQEPELLRKLVAALDIPQHDIYIHFDKSKYTDAVRSITARHAKLTVVSEVNVRWGSYSMVRCEYLLLKLAAQTPHSYYHLLSGADFPLKPAKEIYHYFENSGKQYVLFSAPELPGHCRDWVNYRHISAEKFHSGRTKLANKWYELADLLGVTVQKLLGKKKTLHFPVIQKGSQWFSITEPFARHVLSMEAAVEADFADAYIPDEMFIQTILVNSPWLGEQAAPASISSPLQNSRYIDWTRGGPYTFRIGDLEELKNCGCMFARKFSQAVDPDIIEALSGP